MVPVKEPCTGDCADTTRTLTNWTAYHRAYFTKWRIIHSSLMIALLIGAPVTVAYAETTVAAFLSAGYVWIALRLGVLCGYNVVEDRQAADDLFHIYQRQLREDELVPLNNVLYRLYSEDGELLYVGITSDVVARMAGHRADKYWWGEVARKRFEYLETRAELEAAERLAIIREKPLYNITYHPDRTPPRKPAPTGRRR